MVNKRTVDEILGSLEPAQKEIVENLRSLIKASVPESVELVKNGQIRYKLDGRDFVWISQFGGHVDLEFAMGSSLASGLLRSRGVAESHQKVQHVVVDDFDKLKPELTRLLREAASLGFEHCQRREVG
ncbi:MAG: DUF5655 domain-containing protein [Candidatus Bathyarchaeota archaeon]|nr:DUF5655 domain-containing protein [Candidatus Bathyarchaeota archaeon]